MALPGSHAIRANLGALAMVARGPGSAAWAVAPVLLGLIGLYLPIYLDLAATLWRSDEHSHAPLIALATAFLLWRLRQRFAALPPVDIAWSGPIVLSGGLLLAFVGRTQGVPMLSLASQIPVLAGVLLTLRGPAGLRMAWFPLLFLVFMVPLPGVVVDAMTGPMKEAVSASAAGILYAAGYPVARSGVIVVIGQYQMLMADACSGLHSMLSLAALGVLFTYLIHRGGRVSKGLMLAAVLPIAFAANLMRTATLLLVTYHGGDAVARQWHEAMGVLALLGALGLLVGLEACLSRIEHRRSGPRS